MPDKNRFAKMFALAKEAGMSDEQRNEDLHALVNSICGKESLKELNDSEYAAVVKELQKRASTSGTYKSKCTGNFKGMTEGQERKIWRLMYELKALDKEPYPVSLEKRLCGIIKKELKADASPESPLRWLDFYESARLIEILKRYVGSAERKAMRGV